ncbi:hypothetical protein CHS0354_022660, partial [Potamilus streckersoni]
MASRFQSNNIIKPPTLLKTCNSGWRIIEEHYVESDATLRKSKRKSKVEKGTSVFDEYFKLEITKRLWPPTNRSQRCKQMYNSLLVEARQWTLNILCMSPLNDLPNGKNSSSKFHLSNVKRLWIVKVPTP